MHAKAIILWTPHYIIKTSCQPIIRTIRNFSEHYILRIQQFDTNYLIKIFNK